MLNSCSGFLLPCLREWLYAATIDMPSAFRKSSSSDILCHRRNTKQVTTYMRSIASALFGVLATVGGVPIIRALPGGPTQMISEQLSKVRFSVTNGHSGFCMFAIFCLVQRV